MAACYRGLFGLLLLTALSAGPAAAQIAALPATFEVRTVNGLAVPFQNGMPVPTIEKQRRPIVDLRGIWRRERFTSDHVISLGLRDSAGYAALTAASGNRMAPGFIDAAWPAKNLPSVENTLNGLDNRPEDYEDGVWYRRAFTVPDSLKNQFVRLNFLAVNYVADVWLNGQYLGYHEGGYTPFSFDATKALRTDTTNILAVRVDNPPWGSRNDIVPYGTLSHKPDWFNYTGIIHDVYLEFSSALSIARVEAIPQSVDGTVQATVTLWNKSGSAQNAQLSVEVFTARVDSTNIQTEAPSDLLGALAVSQTVSGIAVQADSATATRLNLTIPSPKLWSPKHPNLYVLRATLLVGGQAVDEMCAQFGIRKLAVTGNTLLLNGKPMFFPGVARHEDHYSYGRSVPKSVIFSDLQKVVDLNATFLRTAHYPNHPYTYLLADRLGIAVLEEVPVWWFDEVNAWQKQDLFRHIHEQMWREMLFRDRNRPSILFWSTCNECLDQTNRKNFIQRLNTELDAQYPDGRFVTESAAADRPGPADPTQAACDVAGWTMYFGIFHGSTYYAGTKQFLQNALTSYPSKPFLDTEFGYWSKEDLGTAPVQLDVFDSTFAAFKEFVAVDSAGTYRPGKPLATTTWWCVFDWYSIQTGNQTMGLYKMDHTTAKPVAARLRAAYKPFKESSENALVGIAEPAPEIPQGYRLAQNFPNPFNPATTITVDLPIRGQARLAVFDLLGREVALLMNGEYSAGRYVTTWDARGMASGAYFIRLSANGHVFTRAMMLVR
jgi:Glycosyl hydrolases family 2, TIM barrel domain/Glycosyl hydrolases family 2, sugar binding domain/Glycosyl hydrolases family 2